MKQIEVETEDVDLNKLADESKESKAAANPVDVATRMFIKDLDALRRSTPMMLTLLNTSCKAAHENYDNLIEGFCDIKEENGAKRLRVPRERYGAFEAAHRKLDSAHISAAIIPRTLLVSLVSQYDVFLARLVAGLFEIKPSALQASSRSMEFSKIVTFESIAQIRQSFIDIEVESLLRKSHHEQFEWLEKKFEIKLRVDLSVWPEFVEITQRRNLFVHADGVVSDQYMTVCKQEGAVIPPDVKVGKVLRANGSYLKRAYQVIFEVGVKLSQVLWRTQEKKSDNVADRSLNFICIELLTLKQYKLARTLLDFALSKPMKHPDKQMFLYLLINRANAYRLSDDAEACKRIISTEDWSTLSAKYRLAYAILVGDLSTTTSVMKEIGVNAEPDKHQYREWPLFHSIENESSFRSTFEEIFGEPFELQELEVTKEGQDEKKGTFTAELPSASLLVN